MVDVLFCLKLIVYCRLFHFSLSSIKIIEWSGSSVKTIKKAHKDYIKEQEEKIYSLSEFIFDNSFFFGIIFVLLILALIYFAFYFQAFLLYKIILMLKVLINFIF